LTAIVHPSGRIHPEEAMQKAVIRFPESPAEARARLSAGFHQHVTIALAACLLALVLG
jgi:hypothetical protein